MWRCAVLDCCFFFQAEDGIRDWSVTGVQTCALPIWALVTRDHIRLPLLAVARGEPQSRSWEDLVKNIVCLMVTVEAKEEDTGEGVHPRLPTSSGAARAIEDRLADQTKH